MQSKPAVPTQQFFIPQNLQQPVALHVHHFCCARRPFLIQPLRHFQQLPQPTCRLKTKTSAAARPLCRNLELILPGVGGIKRPFSSTSFFSQRTTYPVNRPQLYAASSKRNPASHFPKIDRKINGRFPPKSTPLENSKKANGRFPSQPCATLQNLAQPAPREPTTILEKNYDQRPSKMTG